MTNCISNKVQFSSCKGVKVEAEFIKQEITSDGGVLLLKEIDKKLQLTERLTKIIPDKRDPSKIEHSLLSMLRQRIYGLALGYEDINDHDYIRHDLGLQTAVEQKKSLASGSTLCRLENTADRVVAVEMNRLSVELFIESFITPPKEIILDIDATEDKVHGHQEGYYYNGYYECNCFLPLHIFCGEQLLVSYLRPSYWDGAKHSWAIMALLVKQFRKVWPSVKIIVRADAGFCRDLMLRWFEKNKVDYIIGISSNSKIEKKSLVILQEAKNQFQKTQEAIRMFGEFQYAAETWNKERRIIARIEYEDEEASTRYITTNIKKNNPEHLYKDIYCQRANMENRIKEIKNDLYSDRTSCHKWWPNQFRVLLSSMAYILIESTRRLALKNTEFAKAQCSTIRLKLYKIGAVVMRNTRRIRFLFSSSFPRQNLFLTTSKILLSG